MIEIILIVKSQKEGFCAKITETFWKQFQIISYYRKSTGVDKHILSYWENYEVCLESFNSNIHLLFQILQTHRV